MVGSPTGVVWLQSELQGSYGVIKKLFEGQTGKWILCHQRDCTSTITRARFAWSCSIAIVLLVMGNSGCDRQDSSTPVSQGGLATLANRGPEEKYREIMKMFRQEVEGVVTNTSSGRRATSTDKIERTVKDELIPPANPADHYKARITIDTCVKVTFRSTANDEDEEDQKEQKTGSTTEVAGAEPFADINLSLVEDTNDPFAPTLKKSQGRMKNLVKPVVSERVNEYEDTYTLEYKDGRWILTEEPKESLPSFQEAFKYVLNRQ